MDIKIGLFYLAVSNRLDIEFDIWRYRKQQLACWNNNRMILFVDYPNASIFHLQILYFVAIYTWNHIETPCDHLVNQCERPQSFTVRYV